MGESIAPATASCTATWRWNCLPIADLKSFSTSTPSGARHLTRGRDHREMLVEPLGIGPILQEQVSFLT